MIKYKVFYDYCPTSSETLQAVVDKVNAAATVVIVNDKEVEWELLSVAYVANSSWMYIFKRDEG